MKPIPEIDPIYVTDDGKGWTQNQVEQIRRKLNELAAGVNQFFWASASIALRVISGEVKIGPVPPRGVVRYTFAGVGAEEVPHGLDRVPQGYLVIRCYPIGNVADAALADWNAKTAWLQTDLPGLSVTILFF